MSVPKLVGNLRKKALKRNRAKNKRDLRDLNRYRTHLPKERASAANWLHKILEDANIKLTSVTTDVQGVSARRMLEAMMPGETDEEQLADLAK